MDKEYYENLERIVKQMLTPLKNLLFNLVIEAISQKKALPFNKDENSNDILLANLNKGKESCMF